MVSLIFISSWLQVEILWSDELIWILKNSLPLPLPKKLENSSIAKIRCVPIAELICDMIKFLRKKIQKTKKMDFDLNKICFHSYPPLLFYEIFT